MEMLSSSAGIVSWVVLGLIAGLTAKWILPGTESVGFFMTLVVGIAGAVGGGYVSTYFGFGDVTGLNTGSLVISVVGAAVLLFLYGKIFGKR